MPVDGEIRFPAADCTDTKFGHRRPASDEGSTKIYRYVPGFLADQ